MNWRRTGRRILLDILILRPEPASDLTAITVNALLDTGATTCGIARSISVQLGLPSIGKQPILTAGGMVYSERLLFRVGLPEQDAFPFIFDDITGFELTDDTAFQAVLGMDVLSRCDVVLERDGRCTLRYG